MDYTIVPISSDYLDQVRNRGVDHLGQPVRRFVSAVGGEPCRDVLRCAKPGEEVTLASFSPFNRVGPYREYGPIFVLAQPSSEETHRAKLPLPNRDSGAYFNDQFVLRAYDHEENIRDAKLVSASGAAQVLQNFLADQTVAFVHARFPTYGCFACRIDRVD